MGKLTQFDPKEPVRRFERAAPGELLHLDIKKLVKFDKPGHRITGNRRVNSRGAQWELVHVCVDDYTRLAYVEVLQDEKAETARFTLIMSLQADRGEFAFSSRADANDRLECFSFTAGEVDFDTGRRSSGQQRVISQRVVSQRVVSQRVISKRVTYIGSKGSLVTAQLISQIESRSSRTVRSILSVRYSATLPRWWAVSTGASETKRHPQFQMPWTASRPAARSLAEGIKACQCSHQQLVSPPRRLAHKDLYVGKCREIHRCEACVLHPTGGWRLTLSALQVESHAGTTGFESVPRLRIVEFRQAPWLMHLGPTCS